MADFSAGRYVRVEQPFTSAGVRCAAWLYRPATGGPAPCVVLAHGFGMTRECRLDGWARRFAAAGLAALVFDYRGFGDSAGTPRQVLDLAGQRADLRAAVAHARATPGIDPDRIALWGTSFGGGHVLAVAAEDPRLAAVVAQVPFVDGPALLLGALAHRRTRGRAADPTPRESGWIRARVGVPPRASRGGATTPGPYRGRRGTAARVRHTVRLIADAVRDELRRRAGRAPLLVPVAGEVGSGAVIAGPGAERAIRHLVPDGVPWRNEIAAGIALRIPFDRPGRRAAAIRCPLLVSVCDTDAVTPPGPARALAARAPHGEVRSYPYAHFEAYVGAGFEAFCADQVAFLTWHLRP